MIKLVLLKLLLILIIIFIIIDGCIYLKSNKSKLIPSNYDSREKIYESHLSIDSTFVYKYIYSDDIIDQIIKFRYKEFSTDNSELIKLQKKINKDFNGKFVLKLNEKDYYFIKENIGKDNDY